MRRSTALSSLRREVTTKEGQDYAKANKILFMETSAKEGSNIEKVFTGLISQAFECITNIILEKIKSGDINPKEELGIKEGSLISKKIEESTENKKGFCC